jgi:acyl-coenzyme A thioesterase PaaI-like protein
LRLRFADNGQDEVRAHVIVPHSYQGYPGITHGGIIAAILDEAGGRAAMIGHPDRFMVTAKLEIRYRQPIPTGAELILSGRLTQDRGRIAQAHSALYLPDGTVAAEAELSLVAPPPSLLPEVDLEALGWKIYADDVYLTPTGDKTPE